MSDKHGRALGSEPLDQRITAQVGPLYLVAQTQHHFGDAGHTGTANTDKMNAVDATHTLDHVVVPATSRQ